MSMELLSQLAIVILAVCGLLIALSITALVATGVYAWIRESLL